MVADSNIQVSASGQLLFAVHLGDGWAQLVVGLNAVFRTVNIALQLRISQVAKRVDTADQLIDAQSGFSGQWIRFWLDSESGNYWTVFFPNSFCRGLSNFYTGARAQLPPARIAPTQISDAFSKCLAKAGRHTEVVELTERYFADLGELPEDTGIEAGLRKRVDKSRARLWYWLQFYPTPFVFSFPRVFKIWPDRRGIKSGKSDQKSSPRRYPKHLLNNFKEIDAFHKKCG